MRLSIRVAIGLISAMNAVSRLVGKWFEARGLWSSPAGAGASPGTAAGAVPGLDRKAGSLLNGKG